MAKQNELELENSQLKVYLEAKEIELNHANSLLNEFHSFLLVLGSLLDHQTSVVCPEPKIPTHSTVENLDDSQLKSVLPFILNLSNDPSLQRTCASLLSLICSLPICNPLPISEILERILQNLYSTDIQCSLNSIKSINHLIQHFGTTNDTDLDCKLSPFFNSILNHLWDCFVRIDFELVEMKVYILKTIMQLIKRSSLNHLITINQFYYIVIDYTKSIQHISQPSHLQHHLIIQSHLNELVGSILKFDETLLDRSDHVDYLMYMLVEQFSQAHDLLTQLNLDDDHSNVVLNSHQVNYHQLIDKLIINVLKVLGKVSMVIGSSFHKYMDSILPLLITMINTCKNDKAIILILKTIGDFVLYAGGPVNPYHVQLLVNAIDIKLNNLDIEKELRIACLKAKSFVIS
ncbi:hypothetical protein BC833DRAFT_604660 [Globomyces pollinis-pini]|nr:hypothetical protein BC833DRAFT_604660 [Globomyces pollinis-pini]